VRQIASLLILRPLKTVAGNRFLLEERALPKNEIRPAITRFAVSLTTVVAALCALSVDAHAQTPQQQPATQQREHKVKPGDTLWDLAKLYLNDPWSWRLIFEANRAIVENPHWIYPAETLIIPGMQPAVPLGDPVPAAMPRPPVPVPMPVAEPESPAPTPVSIDLRRPVVPLAEYMASPWTQSSPQNDIVGRIVRLVDPLSENDKLAAALAPNVYVHIGELKGSRNVGDSLVIVRYDRTIGEYGRVVEPLGVLRVDSVNPTLITAKLVKHFGPARVGDQVMVMQSSPSIGLGSPSAISGGPRGELLQFVHAEALYGTTDIGFVSLGRASGISIGDEFEVFVPSRAIDNERPEVVPNTSVATVRVIRVSDRTSTVRVLNVNNAALREGLSVRLIRKMN
jgi:hypothetical protein